MPDVDVVIVSYGTRDLTERAVRSALAEDAVRCVFVVDNDSPDDSPAHLETTFAGSRVEVVRLVENRGFGAACNVGAARATAPFLFFLNSDAVIETGAVARLRRRLETDPAVGIVAPAVHVAAGGPLQVDAQGRFPTAWSILRRAHRRPETALEPDWVSGVAMLVRRDEFRARGGFDAAFFMYYEDVELCRRYRAGGQRIVRELSAAVTHRGGASRPSSVTRKAYHDRSQEIYLRRIGTPWVLRVLVGAARRLVRAIPGSAA